jgi:sortase A
MRDHPCHVNRFLRILATALITAGLVVALDVGLTLAWKEPLSSLYGKVKQNQAEDELKKLEQEFPTAADLDAVRSTGDLEEQVAGLADRFEDRVETGEGIGRIIVPAMDVDGATVVEGTDTESLRGGPGHYTASDDPAIQEQGDGSAFPGQGETVGIAGHRTTYGAWFNKMDQIEPGDEITLEMPYATFTYEVQKVDIVDPSEIGVVKNVGYERLVLSACHPLYSAAQRIITFAKLKEINLFGSGERIWQDP